MDIRLYKKSDLDEVIELFYNCVHEINCKDYSEEELDALAPKEVDRYHWEASLDKNHTLVCVKDDKIIGFGNIGKTGFLDRLYVAKKYLKRGYAAKLLKRLESYAKKSGNNIIYVTSPITSMKFFEKHGYIQVEEQVTERRGVRIVRYLYQKKLS